MSQVGSRSPHQHQQREAGGRSPVSRRECRIEVIQSIYFETSPFLASLPAHILSSKLKGQCPEILKLHSLKVQINNRLLTSILWIHIERSCSFRTEYQGIFVDPSAIQQQRKNRDFIFCKYIYLFILQKNRCMLVECRKLKKQCHRILNWLIFKIAIYRYHFSVVVDVFMTQYSIYSAYYVQKMHF